MRIAILAGPWCLGDGKNGLDWQHLFSDRRGLSGSELGYIRMAQELGKLGHEVAIYTIGKPCEHIPENPIGYGIRVLSWFDRASFTGDVVVSWNELDSLECYRDRHDLFRVLSLQINTLVTQHPDIDSYCDAFLSPSAAHRAMILGDPWVERPRVHMVGPWRQERPYTPIPERWHVVPDGCDPEVYRELAERGVKKVKGRCVWTSSPDRGLHWLLSAWPRIKRAVPHAELRVFYKLAPWLDHMLNHDPGEFDPSITEQIQRAHYIAEAMPKARALGVTFYDAVSRRDVSREQAMAECFPYSCDPPLIWSEGYSCSTMECCAAGAVPVLFGSDALPEIYGGACPIARRGDLGVFTDYVIEMLTNEHYRNDYVVACAKLAEANTWEAATRRLVEVLEKR